jgi:hypothetical protein
MLSPRYFHSATTLANGKVLIAGGYLGAPPSEQRTASAELYDPSSNSFIALPDMSAVRVGHKATLLDSGKVLISGDDPRIELFDPATNTFLQAGVLPWSAFASTAVELGDGQVLIAGGFKDSSYEAAATAVLYDPVAGSTKALPDMGVARTQHAGVLLADGRVLLIGGTGDLQDTVGFSSAEIFDPMSGQFRTLGATAPIGVGHTASLLPSGRVLFAGGTTVGADLAQVWDSVGLGPTGRMRSPRTGHSATVLDSGDILLAGGASWGESQASAETYAWGKGTFEAVGTMTQPRSNHAATRLVTGDILMTGGTVQKAVEVYSQSDRAFRGAGDLIVARSRHAAVLMPSGKVLLAGGVDATNELVSSGLDGVCGIAAPGSDPKQACSEEPTHTCGRTGVCGGSTQCEVAADGTGCDLDAVCVKRVCTATLGKTCKSTAECAGGQTCDEERVCARYRSAGDPVELGGCAASGSERARPGMESVASLLGLALWGWGRRRTPRRSRRSS